MERLDLGPGSTSESEESEPQVQPEAEKDQLSNQRVKGAQDIWRFYEVEDGKKVCVFCK